MQTFPKVPCYHAARVTATGTLAVLLTACSGMPAAFDRQETASASSNVESIYVVRSLRVERQMPSTWCTPERAGFAPLRGPSLLEDRFTLHSTQSESRTGRLIHLLHHEVGELRACFGNTADPRVTNFYAAGVLAGVPVSGNGECALVQPNHPEASITTFRCFLQLRGLPAPYVSGLLTSSSIASKAVLGLETDPPGYVHSSIATIRLWRKR